MADRGSQSEHIQSTEHRTRRRFLGAVGTSAALTLGSPYWWTKTEMEIQPEGNAKFQGFLGDYQISVQIDGRSLAGTFRLEADSNTPIEVKLA